MLACLGGGGENPQSTTNFQNRITEVQDHSRYGSESNINYNEGRTSEVSGRTRLSINTRVGDQNLYGPGPSFGNVYGVNNMITRVGDQNLYVPGLSSGNSYGQSNLNTRVGDQNFYDSEPRDIYF